MNDKYCQKQRVLFSDHLDGQKLPLWRGLLVRWHLAVCPLCKRMNQSLEATREALHALRDADSK